jgi:8-oxo-dGTP pyrophosphatase MutT (NUDIX family)
MHIGRHIVQELVLEFGEPEVERWEVELSKPEIDGVLKHRELGRAHDVSLLILDGDRIAVIRKPGYPDGGYRIPSGGIHPEESFLDGATREALEETGLTVRIVDYPLQVHVTFGCGDERAKWTTHVMLAHPLDGRLMPLDTSEIEGARWVDWTELIEKVNPVLERADRGGLKYRARLHDKLYELIHRDKPSQRVPSST